MKRKKLKIEELKVQSFITELQPDVAHTAKGGEGNESTTGCIASVVASIGSIKEGWDIYTDVSKAKSWWPYDGSTACLKITTTQKTTHPPAH